MTIRREKGKFGIFNSKYHLFMTYYNREYLISATKRLYNKSSNYLI
jgi:hypothetical protein